MLEVAHLLHRAVRRRWGGGTRSPAQRGCRLAQRGRNEGSVWQRPDGRWVAAISASISPTGKRIYRYFPTEKAAKAGLRTLLREAETGRIAQPGALTLRDLAHHYMDACRTAGRSDNTLRLYEQHLAQRILPTLGRARLRELRPALVQRLLSALLRNGRRERRDTLGAGLSPSTVRGVYLLLTGMAHFAVKQGYLVLPFTQGVVPPRAAAPETAALREEDLRALLQSAADAGDPLLPLWFVLVDTCCRVGEALGLTWADVALVPPPGAPVDWRPSVRIEHRLMGIDKDGEPVFAEPKARSRRTIPLGRVTADALAALRKASLAGGTAGGLVFVTRAGLPYNRATIHHRLQLALDRAGLPRVSVHGLRHSSATALLRRRVPTEVVSRRLGHASEAITLGRYSHVTQTAGDLAAEEVDKMLDGAGRATPAPADAPPAAGERPR